MARLNHSLLRVVNHSLSIMVDNIFMQGDRIKEVMDVMGWSNADLCRAITSKGLTVSDQAIGKWINGATQNIKGEYFFAIEDLTGFSARWMIEGKGIKKKTQHPLDEHKKVFDEADEVSQRLILTMLASLKNNKRTPPDDRLNSLELTQKPKQAQN